MLTTRLNIRRTARLLNRGGFTLVELLVVIGIIAILAGVALGPITNGIKKAKQSSGTQQAHAIGLALYSAANDNSQLYPDNSGGTAGDVAAKLMAGGYVTDASIFSLSGDQGTGFVKVNSNTNLATTITQNQVSWDFLGQGGAGVDATKNTYLPVLWSTLVATGGGTPPTASNLASTGGTAITATPGANNPFGADGVAVFYVNNSAAFVNSTVTAAGATASVTMVPASNNLGTASGNTYTILSGK